MADYNFAYDDNYDTKAPAAAAAEEKTASHYLRLRGLPYSAKEADIKSFFDGLAVNEIQFIQNAEGRASGEAFVGFSTVADAENGLLRDKNKIGARYIEVFRIGEVEYSRIRNRPASGVYGGIPSGYSNFTKPSAALYGGGGGSHANVIRVRGLPYSCKKEELIGFFAGLTVEEVVFGKEPGDVGRPTGEAYVKFQTLDDAASAMELNGQHLGKRYLEIFRSDLDQFEHFKRQMSSTAMPLNAIQTDWPPWYSDNYDWGGYGMPVNAPTPSRGRGGYRGRGNPAVGGPYRGYEGGPPPPPHRPSPYDYHGRMYGAPPMGGYDAGYDPYGYSVPQYGGGQELNYNKIYLRGLPFRVTGEQISQFFAPLNCVEIKLGYLPDGRTSGDGFVEFGTAEEAQQAKQKDRQSINNRYIEIFDNAMKATPGTTYKRIGGTGRYAPPVPIAHPSTAAYQW